MNKFQIIVIFIGLLLVALAGLAIWGSIAGADFAPWQAVLGFFDGFTAEQVIVGAILGLLAIVPGFGVKALEWLKNKAGLSGNAAYMFIMVCVYAFTAIVLLVTGTVELAGVQFNLANLLGYGSMMVAFTQIAYKRLMEKQAAAAAHLPGVE